MAEKKKNSSGASDGATKGSTIKKKVQTKDSSGNDVQAEVYVNPDGNPIDPPIIPEFEQRLIVAMNRADQDEIDEVNAEYDEAREKRVQRLHDRAKAAA